MKSNSLLSAATGTLIIFGLATTAAAQDPTAPEAMPQGEITAGDMSHMAGHMYMTQKRSLQPGDQQKANAVVATLKAAIAPYMDYRKALADGYEIFLPNIPQRQYHFTNYRNAREAARRFDPAKPTSLLYTKNADGSYKFVGVMYTDRVNASEDELNSRIPLSIAHWHQHINFCKAPPNEKAAYFGPHAKFGLQGSITTQQACEQAGGTFMPHLFGWMVHVYPFETDPKKVWSVDSDDKGHDNMEHSMSGMKMD